LAQSSSEENPQHFATGYRVPRITSSSSRQTANGTSPEPVIVSSRIITVSTRDPIVVSSESVNPLPPAALRGNGRAAGGHEGIGLRGSRRNSDERDEQMLSLEEFLAETSRATTRRVEMEEGDAGHAGPARSEGVTSSVGSAEDLGVIGSGIPNTRTRTNPRHWQTSAAASISSRRQLARGATRSPPPPAMIRSNAEAASMANWNNYARHAGHIQETRAQVQTPLQLAVAGGPSGFFDVVRRIRDIGALQDTLLEPGLREPDLIPARDNESRHSRLSEAQRSSRLRAFQSRLDLISSEFELLRANRIELLRLEQDAVNTLQSLSVTAQPRSSLMAASTPPRPASSPPSVLLQMSQMEQAARIRRDLERIDEETRNLRHAILPEHPLSLPTNNSPRIHADVERLVPRSTSSFLGDFDTPNRTTRSSASRQEMLARMVVPPHLRGRSEASDLRMSRQIETASQLSARTSSSTESGTSSENETSELDPVLSLRDAWARLDQPGLTEMEQLQLQVNIQRLIGQRARRLLSNRAQDISNGPRNSTDTRPDTTPRSSRSAHTSESRQHWIRSDTAGVHEPIPSPTAAAAPSADDTRDIARRLRRQSDRINQQEVIGSFYRQFQRA
jgi:hypothetical protein